MRNNVPIILGQRDLLTDHSTVLPQNMRLGLRTSELPQSYSEKRLVKRSLRTKLWVQWFCPYTCFECNPFTFTCTVGRGSAVAGLSGYPQK